jgi:hypothetical protein
MTLITVGLCTAAYSAAQPTAESPAANTDRDRWLREREVRALEQIARDLGKLQESVNRLDREFDRNSRALEENTRVLGRAR